MRDRAIEGRVVLVTGGTGSFGRAFVEAILRDQDPAAVRIYSRDEFKQYELQAELDDSRVRFLIGDVRDLERLRRATQDVDLIIHAAALKHVPLCEYNPFEAVQTNIVGTENVVTAAIDNHVPRLLALSTDKAVNPVNLYGATKLSGEKIVAQANAYSGQSGARFSVVRYGNVVGSRGSVVPLFVRQARDGEITITDDAMTRFWITLDDAVQFVLASVERMEGGEIFVPKIPSMRIVDLAKAVAPDARWRRIGMRPGEKLHEVLITSDEARHTTDFGGYYAIYPSFPFWRDAPYPQGEELSPAFSYTSDKNDKWLDSADIRRMAGLQTAAGS